MFKMIAYGLVIAFVLVSFKENPSISYIAQYKEIAISEMHRTGIPASIKLAQALLESGAGQSSLAIEANNHFGIKCGGKWDGGEYYLKDDDYNSKGKLVESCFRSFESTIHSFIAHGDFIINQNRYAFLFSYDNKDYQSWAYGLKKAGYATDKAYPQKLINLIEKYELYQYDDELTYELTGALAGNNNIIENNSHDVRISKTPKSFFTYSKYNSSAQAQGKSTQTSRRTRVNDDALYHIVRQGQSIAEIALLYGYDENSVRLRNRIPKDAEPLSGEKIFLRKKISLMKRPKFTREPELNNLASQDEFIF